MTFEIYKLEWILSRHTFGNTTCKCHFNVQNTKSRNIKITALGSCHRYQIIIIYITQKRGANCIYPTNPQIGWPKTKDNIFTLVS